LPPSSHFPHSRQAALRGFALIGDGRLQTVKERRRTLRVGRSLKNRSLVIGEDFQPRADIAGMVLSWVEFRGDAEVGAKEAAAEFGDQFFSRALGSFFGVAAEVSIEALRGRRPMNLMPISA